MCHLVFGPRCGAVIYSVTQIVSAVAIGALSGWLLFPLAARHLFLCRFPDFQAAQNPHLVPSLPQPWNPAPLQRSLPVLCVGKWDVEVKFWAPDLSSSHDVFV